jgi:hypothetical protein
MALNHVPFPATDHWQLFPASEQLPSRLDPTKDGAHRLPGAKFFEWWYFDAYFDNGYHLVVALHTALLSITSRPAVIEVRLYGPAGRRGAAEVATFKPSEVRSAVARCDVELGPSRVWDAGDYYGVYVEQGVVRASLEYHREVEGLQIGTGVLFADPVSGQSFHWVIPLPRASVSGWLQVGDERMDVTGVGYHDHNWGNLDLRDVLQRWTWGRVVADEYTMIFWDLFGRGAVHSRTTLFMLWQGSELLLSTDQAKIYSVESQIEGRTDSCPNHIKLQVDDGLLHVRAVLRARRVFDVTDFAQPRFRGESARRVAEKVYFISEKLPLLNQWVKRWVGYGTYLRLQVDCELTVTSQGQTDCWRGNALCERMDFGAAL